MPSEINLDLKNLRQFCELAEIGNFGRAATRLGVSQPGLSRAIRRLEQNLGVDLIKRHSKGVVLTEHGEKLRETTSILVRSIEHLKAVQPLHETQNVVIGVPSSLGPLISEALFREFSSQKRDATLHIVELTSAKLQQATISGWVDAALLYDPPDIDDLHNSPVTEEMLLAVFPPMWELPFRGASIPLRSLMEFPIILHSPAQSERQVLLKAEHKHSLSFSPLLEVDSPSTLKALVRSGLGCSVTCMHAVSDEINRGVLVGYPLSSPTLTMKLHISVLGSTVNSEYGRLAVSILRKAVTHLLEESAWPGAVRCVTPE